MGFLVEFVISFGLLIVFVPKYGLLLQAYLYSAFKIARAYDIPSDLRYRGLRLADCFS